MIQEIKVGTSTFKIRGLTVGEYMSIRSLGFFDQGHLISRLYAELAVICIEGWENIVYNDEFIPFDKEFVRYLPAETLHTIGEKCYELSILSKEDRSKIEGYIKFLYWLDEPERETEKKLRRSRYDCTDCIKNKRCEQNKCGLTQTQRDSIYTEKTDDHEDLEVKPVKKKKSAREMMSRQMVRSSSKRKTSKRSSSSTGLEINGFVFPQCPVSWIDSSMEEWIDRLMYCHRNKIVFFSGGLQDQSNRVYMMLRMIESSMNDIEAQRYKDFEQETSNGSKKTKR